MKAIQTRYKGPTDARGSHIQCKAEGCAMKRFPFPYHSDTEHLDAAVWYAREQGWLRPGYLLVSGGLPDGSYAHVFVGVPDDYTNDNGLTWEQWFNAATLTLKSSERREVRREARIQRLWCDFLTGVDPSDWARHFAQEHAS